MALGSPRFIGGYLATAAVVLAAVASGACTRGEAQSATRSPVASRLTSRSVIDSTLPPEETLRRFRANHDSVVQLDSAAAPTRRTLLTRFARALAARDTSELQAIQLSRDEFAWLYFPSSIYVTPPYVTSPDVVWRLMQARSTSGMNRLVSRLGTPSLEILGTECEKAPTVEGANHFYRACVVRFRRRPGSEVEHRRLFGSIIERDGRWKIVSYANDF